VTPEVPAMLGFRGYLGSRSGCGIARYTRHNLVLTEISANAWIAARPPLLACSTPANALVSTLTGLSGTWPRSLYAGLMSRCLPRAPGHRWPLRAAQALPRSFWGIQPLPTAWFYFSVPHWGKSEKKLEVVLPVNFTAVAKIIGDDSQ